MIIKVCKRSFKTENFKTEHFDVIRFMFMYKFIHKHKPYYIKSYAFSINLWIFLFVSHG